MTRPILTAVLALGVLTSSAMAQVPPFVTSWGSFGTGDSQFYTPVGIAVDSDGIVYVVDSNLDRLTRFTRTGAFLSQWAVDAPVGVAVGADGFVYVTHVGVISKYTKTGMLVAEWSAGYTALTWIAVDTDGSLFVSSGHGVILRFSSSGALLSQWAAFLTPGFPDLESLDGLAVDGLGHFYTVQKYTGLVSKFTTAGTLMAQWAVPTVGSEPVRVATSPDGSKVYVVDNANQRILVFTDVGGSLGQWGTAGTGPGQFLNPIGIAVDGLGSVFVADTNNSRIQVFGDRVTSTQPISWGDLKRRFR